MKKKNDPLFNGSPLDTQILHPYEPSHEYPYLGYHTEMFWIDLVRDEVPEKRMISLDKNSTALRSLIFKTESKGLKVKFTGIRVIIQYKFNDEPEEWTVSL
jgi:hypothetical protein